MEKKNNWYVNKKKYHFIYKTTCNVTNKYYIGMHSTDDLEDGYIGSGTYLWHSIKKHGREKHSIEILEFCDDRESLKSREKELVNEEILTDSMCMNLKIGGSGGFPTSAGKNGIDKQRELRFNEKWAFHKNEAIREKMLSKSKILSERMKKLHLSGKINYSSRIRSSLNEEHKRKIGKANSINQLGNKNSQFGTVWITNGNIAKKVKNDELENYISSGWKRGRKILCSDE